MAHQEEWLVLRATAKKIDRQVGDHISNVAFINTPPVSIEKSGIEVHPLSRQDSPFIKACRVATQMPFPNHTGVVARGLQVFRYSGL